MRPYDRTVRRVRRGLFAMLALLFVVLPACECVPADAGPLGLLVLPRCEAGPEVAVASADGNTEPSIGARFNYRPGTSPLGLGVGIAKGFPDAGSSYSGWIGARYERPSEGSVNLFAEAGPTVSRFSYSTDEYEIPGDFSELGGGAFQQGTGLGGQNSYGLRFGVGAVLNRPDSRWRPYGQVGYDLFFGGVEIDNHLRFSGGVTYRIGQQEP